MPSTFSGLEIALRSLRTHQRAIEVVNHNIANVNNEGYSRQRALLVATDPYTVPAMNREESVGQVGTGVMVSQIHRYSSEYLNSQMRHELPRLGRWQVIDGAMNQMEVVFQEPSDTGISAALGRFWQAWSDLAAMPEDLAARAAATEASSNLAFAIRDADTRLRDLRQDMDLQVRQSVARINDITVELAALNDTIGKVQAFGDQPNDLRDRRDGLIDELARIVDINTMHNTDGTVTVAIGGHPLVMGNDRSELLIRYDDTNDMMAKVMWADSGTPLVVRGVELAGGLDEVGGALVGGQLGGAMYARDVLVPAQMAKLDVMAEALIGSVNRLHASGYGLPDESVGPPPAPRPGSAVENATYAAGGPVSAISLDLGSPGYPLANGLGAGTYTVVTDDTGLRFRVLDSMSRPVSINALPPGSGTTDDWQDLPAAATTLHTGRGFQIDFDGTTGHVGQAAGFDYRNFMSGSVAADLDVSDWVRRQPLNVATAAGADASGDGSVALAIARLRTTAVIDEQYSVDGYYHASITDLGLASKQSASMVANAGSLIEHLQRRKDEVSAVDLDEETVNLIQYQRAYQGAARVLTAVDEMLDRLINGTGIVGR